MPRALAIETSGRIGSVAVIDDDRVIAEEVFQHGLANAAQIIPIIDRLVRTQRWRPDEVEQLYVSVGPGSFTGLRIGISLAKTMALATGVKLLAVPTVRVLAENAPADAAELIIVLDAKRDQIFTARFTRQAECWIEKESARVDSLTNMLARAARPVHLLGEGIPKHQKFLPADPGIILTDPQTWRARASAVAKIGMSLARRGEFADPFTLTPTYIRKSEAEEKADRIGSCVEK